MNDRRVLIVEDDAGIAALEADLIATVGGVPTIVGDGAKALVALEQTIIDLILLDLSLPQLTGQALLHCLAKNPRLNQIPVIVVSANAEKLVETPQVIAVLAKPFNVGEMATFVAHVLGNGTQRPRPESRAPGR